MKELLFLIPILFLGACCVNKKSPEPYNYRIMIECVSEECISEGQSLKLTFALTNFSKQAFWVNNSGMNIIGGFWSEKGEPLKSNVFSHSQPQMLNTDRFQLLEAGDSDTITIVTNHHSKLIFPPKDSVLIYFSAYYCDDCNVKKDTIPTLKGIIHALPAKIKICK